MIEIFKIILYGIVEGVTEWLPISSTGHLIIIEKFLKLNYSADFIEMLRVLIQLGAILAVVILYFYKLNPFTKKKNKKERKETYSLWFKVILATIPAAILGFLFDDKINELLFNFKTVAVMLILYGIIFIVVEKTKKEERIINIKELTLDTAFLIGLFQVLALIPGTSRSGVTIIGALILGLSRETATEFTFFLGIPVMFGASILKLFKFGLVFTSFELVSLLVSFVVAFIISIITIRFLINYVKKNDFKVFGYYRIILGIILLLVFYFGR